MGWNVTAAIAAITTVALMLLYSWIIPFYRKRRIGRVLEQVSATKDKAISLQNSNMNSNLNDQELMVFKEAVVSLKAELLDEIAHISKTLARQYQNFGALDTQMFIIRRTTPSSAVVLDSQDQVLHLAILKRCWELADAIVDKYS